MRIFVFAFMLLAALQLAWGQERMSARQASQLVKVEALTLDSAAYDSGNPSVDMPPEYPGGTLALLEHLVREMRYPKAAWKRGAAGEVVVQFVIAADGSIGDINVVKPLDPDCDAEAARVMGTLPSWTPACRAGRAVPVGCTLTVRFGD